MRKISDSEQEILEHVYLCEESLSIDDLENTFNKRVVKSMFKKGLLLNSHNKNNYSYVRLTASGLSYICEEVKS